MAVVATLIRIVRCNAVAMQYLPMHGQLNPVVAATVKGEYFGELCFDQLIIFCGAISSDLMLAAVDILNRVCMHGPSSGSSTIYHSSTLILYMMIVH